VVAIEALSVEDLYSLLPSKAARTDQPSAGAQLGWTCNDVAA
jgi:hypothetical protein